MFEVLNIVGFAVIKKIYDHPLPSVSIYSAQRRRQQSTPNRAQRLNHLQHHDAKSNGFIETSNGICSCREHQRQTPAL